MNPARDECRELNPVFYPYLDGELDLDERLEIEGHLAHCAACATRVQAELRFRDVVRARTRKAACAPEALRARISEGVHSAHRRRQIERWMKVSAAALVVVSVGGWAVANRTTERERHFLDDAARRHARRLPAEVQRNNNEAVEAWFDGKLDYRVTVPTLANARITGARLSDVSDRPAAYINYQTRDAEGAPRRVGLFVLDDAHDDFSAQNWPRVQLARSRGYNVATWRDGEIVYELVSDLAPREIRGLLRLAPSPNARQRLALPGPVPQPVPRWAGAFDPPASPTIDLRPVSLRR